MINLFSPLLIVIYAVLFGITMKIADLLDEHGLKWFKGSTILFGFFWGGFGALIILSNNILANIYLAIILAFVLRYRIDFLNHGIATTIMFLTFLSTQTINWNIFLIFFISFATFGLIHDYLENKKFKENILKKLSDLRTQYYLIPLIYSIITGTWIVFFTVSLNMLSYEITLRQGMKIIKKQKKH